MSSDRPLKLSFSWMQHTLSTYFPWLLIIPLLLFVSSISFEKPLVCYPSAPCSPHRSPFYSSLNPADHSRAGLHQGGSQSTPNTPKVWVRTLWCLICKFQTPADSLCFFLHIKCLERKATQREKNCIPWLWVSCRKVWISCKCLQALGIHFQVRAFLYYGAGRSAGNISQILR